jgi:predicted DNA-binding transcriptional regulator AlpA
MNQVLATKMQGESDKLSESLLRKRDVARLLACSNRTVDRLVSAGLLTRVKILGAVRFRLSQVELLIKGGDCDFQS